MSDKSTTEHKTFAFQTKPTPETQDSDSIVKACLPFADLLKGEVVHVSFDCPENLRTAFNSTTKANGSSTCHVLRSMMEAYVVSNHYTKACYGNTMKPVVIENVNMPTYVKSRRRRLKVVEESSETVQAVVCVVCGRAGYAKAIDVGGVRVLCKADFEKVKRSLLGWKVLE